MSTPVNTPSTAGDGLGCPPLGLVRSTGSSATCKTMIRLAAAPRGERKAAILRSALRLLKVGAALCADFPTSFPMLFQGRSGPHLPPFLYFTDHQEAALAKAVREAGAVASSPPSAGT